MSDSKALAGTLYAPNLGCLFRSIVKAYREAPAIVFADSVISYGEIEEMALCLAGKLKTLGLQPHDVMVINGEKSPVTYGLIIACLLSGAPYVLIDPDNPPARQCRILERCQAKLVYVGTGDQSRALSEIAGKSGAMVLTPEGLGTAIESAFEPARITGSHPAYIMFTSGSTGFPKGAVMSHSNVARLIAWSRDRFGFGPGEILTNVNPLYFDNSVFDIYSALFTGAALAPFSKDEMQNPRALLQGVEARGCTSWFSVPSLLMYLDSIRALASTTMPKVRRFVFGGEGYPLGRLKSLYDKFGGRAEIVNVYGPTECTCICSSYSVGDDDFGDLKGFPPLGALTPEFSGVVVGEDDREISPGESGELVLYGPCVGLGYYNDPDRTRQAFVSGSRNGMYMGRGYRTGDIVTVSPDDGKIRIQGRRDNQVKHMGYRIELEEVENALCAIPGIHQAAVLHGKRYGNSCLSAIVSANGHLTEDDIFADLRKRVPSYMIPVEVQIRDNLPKNPNGKLDRSKLKAEYFAEE